MRRLAPLALVLAAALLAGTARADTFAVVPSTAFSSSLVAPALTPNATGSVGLPLDLELPPSAPAQLSSTELLTIWQRAGAAYGIPWSVLASINKVESNFGRNMGPSSAGAIGWMQFMPDTWLRWGTDANGDGVADPWNPDDAVFSAARYLSAAGGSTDLYRAVYAYNHADWYVKEVLDLANVYGSSTGAAFSLDRLQVSLDSARSAVVAAGGRLLAAEAALRAIDKEIVRRQARAARAPLLSDRLALEAVAGQTAVGRDAATELVARETRGLADARAALVQAQQQSAPASFAPAAAQLFGSPSYSSGYVFPVGGGPGVVFASHTHHDYPAVDIAAPLGSPLYALAASVVERSWSAPDPTCGIGLTLRAFDGQVWTYCHLSVLDPAIVPGATLTAGEEVGLVGATGDATGPHLHLQLQPAVAWPQEEPWFQSFAGAAFTWSDSDGEASPGVRALAIARGGAAFVSAESRVFRVVSAPVPPKPAEGVVFFSSRRP